MTGKRKHDDAPTTTLRIPQDNTTSHLPLKRRKNQDATASTIYTVSQILAFKDGVSRITDWTSPTVSPKHVQVIYWFDVEGLTKSECIKRYPNKDGRPCSATNIFKVYNTYAPRFYAEKGLAYIPLGKRGVARAQPVAPATQKKERTVSTRDKVSRLDIELKRVFGKLAAPISPALKDDFDQDVSAPCAHLTASNSANYLVAPDDDVLEFICKVNSTAYGPTSGLHIPRASLIRHCNTIRAALFENPNIRAIHYGPEISADTISRFAACIKPTLQPHLPTHITTQSGTFDQQWTMSELEDLYVFAVTIGAYGVCDLVIDRWVQELKRPEPRMLQNDHGDAEMFNMLGFGPELLSFLQANDEQGFKFFLSVLVTHGHAGWALLRDTRLRNWHEDMKKALIETIDNGRAVDLATTSWEIVCAKFHHHDSEEGQKCVKRPALGTPQPAKTKTARPIKQPTPRTQNLRRSRAGMGPNRNKYDNILQLRIPDFPYVHNQHPAHDDINNDPVYSRACTTDRLRQHRNDYMDERMRYANPHFNAHHDTVEVCEEKLRMVREKLALFKEREIEVSDEEVDEALGVLEDLGEVEEDEDGDYGDDEEEEEFEVL